MLGFYIGLSWFLIGIILASVAWIIIWYKGETQ